MSCPLHSIDYELFDTHDFICPHALMHAGSDKISQSQPYTILCILLILELIVLQTSYILSFLILGSFLHNCIIILSYIVEQCSLQ